MKYQIFKVLHHRESKNVYIFDVKLYEVDEEGHKTVVAEGRASANIKENAGQCSLFGENYNGSKNDTDEVVMTCLRRAKKLQEKVFKKE